MSSANHRSSTGLRDYRPLVLAAVLLLALYGFIFHLIWPK